VSSALIVRAVRRIQKIIQVTKPTAMIDSTPPKASRASNDRSSLPKSYRLQGAPSTPPRPVSAGPWRCGVRAGGGGL
jgi:hypothetical protein